MIATITPWIIGLVFVIIAVCAAWYALGHDDLNDDHELPVWPHDTILPPPYYNGTAIARDTQCYVCGRMIKAGSPYRYGRVGGEDSGMGFSGVKMGRWHVTCEGPDYYGGLR
jgi:hypothetical protein